MGFSTKAVQFDGVNEFVTAGNVLSFEYTDDFSVSCWIKHTATSGFLVCKQTIGTEYRGYALEVGATGAVGVWLRSDEATSNAIHVASTTTGLNDGNWHHIVFTWKGNAIPVASDLKIYVDGNLETPSVLLDNLTATIVSTASLNFGARNDGSDGYWAGTLDEVAVYDKELSSVEVTEIFNEGAANDLSSLGSVSNLVGWWRMGDDDVFPILYDWVGTAPRIANEIDSTDGDPANMTSANVRTHAPNGIAAKFDGTNEYVTMGDVHGFERTDTFSLSCWFKTSAPASYNYLISKMPDALIGYGMSVTFSGTIMFGLLGSPILKDEIATTATFNDNKWHHVVATNAGTGIGGMLLYVDGVPQATSIVTNTLGGNSILNTDPFQVAVRSSGTWPLTGSLDEVSVYDKVLTGGEVTTIYNSSEPPDLTSVGPTGNLVGWWRMGESDIFPTIYDRSVNSNDGTMVNMEPSDFVPLSPGRYDGGFSTKSMLFDGVNQYLDMRDTLDFERTDPFSLVVWFRSDQASDQILVAKQTTSPALSGYALILESDGDLRLDLVNDWATTNYISVHTTTDLIDNGWHCVVVTFSGNSDESGISFYVDGSPTTHTPTLNNLSASTLTSAPFRVGTRADGTLPFDGYLDEVAVYDKELSASEASWVYSAGDPIDLLSLSFAGNLIGWWRMGEEVLPGGGNDGTMTNMELGDIISDAPSMVQAEVALTGDASIEGTLMWLVGSSVAGDADVTAQMIYMVEAGVSGDATLSGTSMWLVESSVSGDASIEGAAEASYEAEAAVAGDAQVDADMTFLIYCSVEGDATIVGTMIYTIESSLVAGSSISAVANVRRAAQEFPTVGHPPPPSDPRTVGYQPGRESPPEAETLTLVVEK